MAFLPMIVAVLISFALQVNGNDFDTNYYARWGEENIVVGVDGSQVTLQLDQSSGSGFTSKENFGSGLFHFKLKLPPQRSPGGVVTTFYLINVGQEQAEEDHFEVDFEFVGTTGRLSTNIFNNDGGHREQGFQLWFDPSLDFHNYDILWNPRHIVFFVDNVPIRVFKNNTAQGFAYPNKPMHIEASIWNTSGWAGNITWTHAPFIATYKDLGINACPVPAETTDVLGCASQQLPWNKQNFMKLTDEQKQQLKDTRAKHMNYNYCDISPDKKRECELNEELVDDESLWMPAPWNSAPVPPPPADAPLAADGPVADGPVADGPLADGPEADSPSSDGPDSDSPFDDEEVTTDDSAAADKCVTTNYGLIMYVFPALVFLCICDARGLVRISGLS